LSETVRERERVELFSVRLFDNGATPLELLFDAVYETFSLQMFVRKEDDEDDDSKWKKKKEEEQEAKQKSEC
jgi:hypothetical protein